MNKRRAQTISSLLNSVKGNRGNVAPKPTLFQIQKLLLASNFPKYPHQILNIYHHLSIYKDQLAFNRLDAIIFPAKNSKQHLKNITFRLAIRRLFCLIKYHKPYRNWLQLMRELLQDAETVTSTDAKYVLQMSNFEKIYMDEKYQMFYNQFLTVLEENVEKIDSGALISLRKYLVKNKLLTGKKLEVKNKLSDKLVDFLNQMSSFQLKFMFHSRKTTTNQLYQFFFRFQSNIKRYGFLFMFLESKDNWCKMISEKYSRKQIIEMLPTSINQPKPITIIQNLFSFCILIRPFIDQFFPIQKIKTGQGKQQYRLLYPNQHYISYIINAYYWIFPGVLNPQQSDFNRISQILSQTQYLVHNPNYHFVYFSVMQIITHCQHRFNFISREQKIKKQKELVLQLYQLLRKYEEGHDYRMIRNFLLLPTNAYKNIAIMEEETFRLGELSYIVNRLGKIKEEISEVVIAGGVPSQYQVIDKVVKQFLKGQKPVQNRIIHEQYRKHPQIIHNLQIWYAKNPQVNNILQTKYIVKLKSTESQKQVKYLLDHSNFIISSDQESIILGKLWKTKYLKIWCQLQFKMEFISSMDQYLHSKEFQNTANELFK